MDRAVQDYNFFFFQWQLQQAAGRPAGVPPPVPRVVLLPADTIQQYQFNLKNDPSRSCLLKSLLFKYPPSVVYMMPGSLQVIIGLRNGKVLVWQTLNNFMLSSHSLPISHALGFYDADDSYLITFSKLSGEFCLWNINATLNKTEKQIKKIGESNERLLYKVVLPKEFATTVRSIAWQDLSRTIYVYGERVHIWRFLKDENATTLNWILQLGEKDKKITCEFYDDKRSLLMTGFEDGSLAVYFVPTGQCMVQLPSTKSNQYFSLFHVEADNHTMIAVDDYCIHWRNLGKIIL